MTISHSDSITYVDSMMRTRTKVSWQVRFWAKVNKTDTCWLWTGRCNRKGYGEFRSEDGSTQLAHRISWLIAYGKSPEPCALHTCDTPNCVRPDHLFEGTKGDNNRDMYAKNRGFRGQHAPSGERNGAAKLTWEDVKLIRESSLSSRKIASQFGVSSSAIINIRAGKVWREQQ
jgi:hypothetical protein